MDNKDILYEIATNLDIEDLNAFILINKNTYSLLNNNFDKILKNNKLKLILRAYNRFMKIFKSEFVIFLEDIKINGIIATMKITDKIHMHPEIFIEYPIIKIDYIIIISDEYDSFELGSFELYDYIDNSDLINGMGKLFAFVFSEIDDKVFNISKNQYFMNGINQNQHFGN